MVIKLSRKFFLFAALTVIWMGVIFFFSSQNGEESSGVSEKLLMFLCGLVRYTPSPDMKQLLTLLIRKGAHMTEFGILALLWLGTLRSAADKAKWHYTAAFAAASLYAATDEMHQRYSQTDMHDAFVACCRVYGIEVIDIFKDSPLDTSDLSLLSECNYTSGSDPEWECARSNDTDYINGDGVHPLNRCYLEYYVPIILQHILAVRRHYVPDIP